MLFVFRIFTLVALLVVSVGQAIALDINVVDQDGNPLVDAYVAIPSGEISAPKDEPAVMDQIDVKFVPHVLAIDQGQSVVFPNSDNIRHHVYSFSDPKRFEIKLYQGVPKKPVAFDKPGLVALGCNIHDSMLAYIYVSPWPVYGVSDKSGKVAFETEATEIEVWHPWLKGKTKPERFDIASLKKNNQVTVTLNVTKPKPVKSFKNTRRLYND